MKFTCPAWEGLTPPRKFSHSLCLHLVHSKLIKKCYFHCNLTAFIKLSKDLQEQLDWNMLLSF